MKTISQIRNHPSALGEEDSGHRPFLLIVLGLVTAGLWLPAMASSLTFDETGTFWIIRRGVGGLSISYKYGGVGPFFYFIEWLTKSVLGTSEIALRMPALVAGLVSIYLTYRIGKRLFDSETGLLASLVLVSSSSVIFAVNDARPYAIALMFLLAASLVLIHISDRFRWGEAVLYVICVAAMLYLSYMFATALVAHAIYVLARRRSDGELTIGKALVLLTLIAASVAPAIPHIVEIISRRDLLSVPGDSSSTALLNVVLAPAVGVGLTLGVILSLRWRSLSLSPLTMTAGSAALLVSWWLATPLILYVTTNVLNVNVFWPRYLLPFIGGFALLVGWIMRSVRASSSRRILVVVLLIISVWSYGSQHLLKWHSDEQVRGMAQVIRATVTNSNTPVLMPGFIETAHIEWLTDPEKVSAQLAPISYYSIPGRPILIPYRVSAETEGYLENVTERSLLTTTRFILVERVENGPVKSWLDARLKSAKYHSALFNGSGSIWIYEYFRGS